MQGLSVLRKLAGSVRSAILPGMICLLSCDLPAQESDRITNRILQQEIQPLLRKYCFECHSGKRLEAEINLASSGSLAEMRKQTGIWIQVTEMLHSGQMPPRDSATPTDGERREMLEWIRGFLTGVARESAGDPGPVILRRLNNAQYTNTLRDLTGLELIDPAREFPGDSAAGEGFTNTGATLVMSPSLLTKYLDASRELTQHVVLLPDGFRFSESPSRSDWTNESLDAIRDFYRRYTASGGGAQVNLQGIVFDTNQGGVLAFGQYLRFLASVSPEILRQPGRLRDAAENAGLNARYSLLLASALTGKELADSPVPESLILSEFRREWLAAQVPDRPAVAAKLERQIAAWQGRLWKFQPVGHLGREGGTQRWLESVNPVETRRDLNLAFPASGTAGSFRIELDAREMVESKSSGTMIWSDPRLVLPESITVPLAQVRDLTERTRRLIGTESRRLGDYLGILAESRKTGQNLEKLALERNVNEALLRNLGDVVKLGQSGRPTIKGLYTNSIRQVQGYEAINGWGSNQTPSLIANRSDQDISFLTLTVPARGIVMHPSPTLEAVIAWRSPVDMSASIDALVKDADEKCGNGAAWRLELESSSGSVVMSTGFYELGGRALIKPSDPIPIRIGDVVRLVVNARDGNHACDSTHVNLVIREAGGEKRVWDLAADVVDRILESNPVRDSHDHAGVWHFCSSEPTEKSRDVVVPGSSLAAWREAVVSDASLDKLKRLQDRVASRLVDPVEAESADARLRDVLLDWQGPLRWLELAQAGLPDSNDSDLNDGPRQKRFGGQVGKKQLGRNDVAHPVGIPLVFTIPAELAQGGQLAVSAAVSAGPENSSPVHVRLRIHGPGEEESIVDSGEGNLLIPDSSGARERLVRTFDGFRSLFPPVLCYERIVPVDEVVTLILFHREDDALQRLMLEQDEIAELDRLWDELSFISRDALRLVDSYEQIVEFATQDRPDLVVSFASLRKPITERARLFEQEMVDAEPIQLAELIAFASRAFRRPLQGPEQAAIRGFYTDLREQGQNHGVAFRNTLARILVSPDFLYRIEQPAAGASAKRVTDHELAVRLSYFLWSSGPDARLRELADAGELGEEETLRAETRRMLRDPRSRRLAVEFGGQWLHIYGFDQLDEKSPRAFPTFSSVKASLYEEAIRFMGDCFQQNRPVSSLLTGQQTFVNETLARHYGMVWPVSGSKPGQEWVRTRRPADQPAAGILTLGAVLARQSGASRTSPILRGNFITEVLLGERLPRPPPSVPMLDEEVPEGLTERQLIERHSKDPSCSRCHARIDPYGFALESYDGIGRFRRQDAQGNKIDTRTRLPDGIEIDGMSGLRDYMMKERRSEFVRQFCRKLLGYALGRPIQLSDQTLLDELTESGVSDDSLMVDLVLQIVTSPQFREIRGRDWKETP